MVVEWLVLGAVIATPLCIYVAAIGLLNRMLRKEGPKIFAVHLSSKQDKPCVATSTANDENGAA